MSAQRVYVAASAYYVEGVFASFEDAEQSFPRCTIYEFVVGQTSWERVYEDGVWQSAAWDVEAV